MRLLFQGTVPKDLLYPECNEDTANFDRVHLKAVMVDGASESFDSTTWGKIIAGQYLENSRVDSDWLRKALEKYLEKVNVEELSWSKAMAFERGSFATLMGINSSDDGLTINLFSVGDCLAVLCTEDGFKRSWPFEHSTQFDAAPVLFSTNFPQNAFLDDKEFMQKSETSFDLKDIQNPKLLLVTDALGQCILRSIESDESILDEILGIKSEKELEILVVKYRGERKLKIDDSTMMLIDLLDQE